jgi:hypothetical protein
MGERVHLKTNAKRAESASHYGVFDILHDPCGYLIALSWVLANPFSR